jgi:protein disulfide-isomerase-like protein
MALLARGSAAPILLLCAVALLSLLSLASAQVVVLTDDNFEEKTAQGDWLLEFYAPWCGHCKRLEPVWDELASSSVKRKDLNVGKVDCTTNPLLKTRFQIKGFPTIYLLKDKQLYPYSSGKRQLENFLEFDENGYSNVATTPWPTPTPPQVPSKDVLELTADNLNLLTNGGKWFVTFYAPWCPHCKSLMPTWKEAAEHLQGKVNLAKLDCTAEPLICYWFDITAYPILKFFAGDGTVRDYTGLREVSAFGEFVEHTYTKTATKPYPIPSYLQAFMFIFKLYHAFEPIATWIKDNTGYALVIVAALGLVLGFLLGRLSARPQVRYVIPSELAPLWNQLLVRKKEKDQKRKDKKKKVLIQGSDRAAVSSPQKKRRSKGAKEN